MTNARNVSVGRPRVGGAIFRAPLGTELPTDEATELPSAFIPQGYAAAEGLQRAIQKAYEIIRAWGGDEVARPRTEITVTMTLTLIEAANGDVATTIWGEDDVTVTPATANAGTKIAVAYQGEELPDSVWAFDMADGSNLRRVVLPRARIVTESFEQTFGDSQVIAYPVTLTLFRDENQKFFYEYSDNGVTAA